MSEDAKRTTQESTSPVTAVSPRVSGSLAKFNPTRGAASQIRTGDWLRWSGRWVHVVNRPSVWSGGRPGRWLLCEIPGESTPHRLHYFDDEIVEYRAALTQKETP